MSLLFLLCVKLMVLGVMTLCSAIIGNDIDFVRTNRSAGTSWVTTVWFVRYTTFIAGGILIYNARLGNPISAWAHETLFVFGLEACFIWVLLGLLRRSDLRSYTARTLQRHGTLPTLVC